MCPKSELSCTIKKLAAVSMGEIYGIEGGENVMNVTGGLKRFRQLRAERIAKSQDV